MKKQLTKIMVINCITALAEFYKNEGNDQFKKRNFQSAIHYYTKGIKVNCKDKEMNAKLYSNRAAARINFGKKIHLVVCNIVFLYFNSQAAICSNLLRMFVVGVV